MSEVTLQIYKGDGTTVITATDHPLCYGYMSELSDRFVGENKLDAYYLPESDYKALVQELYGNDYHYDSLYFYNADKVKILDINKLF